MPILQTRVPAYKPAKEKEFSWDEFRGGLNTLLKENEIKGNELAQTDNLVLIGKGVPTKRWGTEDYFLANTTGSTRGLAGYYQTGEDPELLALTDTGFLTKKANASYSSLTGASWASGFSAEMAQLSDKMYVVSESREMVKYDGTSLTGFPTIATPTGTFATQISGASGENTYSYRISVTTDVGETLASTAYQVGGQPQDLVDGSVKVDWTTPSAASGTLNRFNVYGRDEGDERFLGSVDWQSNTFIDDGSAIPAEFTFPPTADTTGGVKAKYIIRFQDRLIYAGIDGEPSKVIVSAREPLHESSDISYGGNYINIEKDAGDDITGLVTFQNKIIVFKERSIWQVTLGTVTVGNFVVTQPEAKLLTGSVGCIAPRSIKAVENDIFFLSRRGVYTLGNEAGFLGDILRSNEISAKVRPFFNAVEISQKKNATAVYFKFKYLISFPGLNKTMVFDRERLAWMGPWSRDARIYEVFTGSSDDEHLIYGQDDSPTVVEYDSNFGDDSGTIIDTILRTKKEDFGDWVRFKNIKDIFTQFRNVSGQVNVDIKLQERSGDVTTAKSFSITTSAGNAGWGSGQWGNAQWADSEEQGGAADISEVYRFALLNKAARNIQLIMRTTHRNDDYELLGIRGRGTPMGLGFLPSGEKV